MSLAAARIESAARDLVIEEGFGPLEQVLPQAGRAAGLFNACVARLDGDRLEIHAMLAWHSQQAVELEGRASALWDALEEASPGLSQRISATLLLVTEDADTLSPIWVALSGLRSGHFLEKIQMARAAAALDTLEFRREGRLDSRPESDWFEEHLAAESRHSAAELNQTLEAAESEERRLRRLLKQGDTWATWVLIALNSAAFAGQMVLQGRIASASGAGLQPAEAANLALMALGANGHDLVFGQGEWWRLGASMFLHGGFEHLMLNMISLFMVGGLAERLAGPWRFVLIYILAGLAGSLFSALQPGGLSVGASGAILGIAGALLALNFRRPAGFPKSLAGRIFQSLLPSIGLTFGLGFLLSAFGGPVKFDNAAHFGGLFMGFCLVLLFPRLLQKPLR